MNYSVCAKCGEEAFGRYCEDCNDAGKSSGGKDRDSSKESDFSRTHRRNKQDRRAHAIRQPEIIEESNDKKNR